MDSFYLVNEDFVNKLYERTLLSVNEASNNDVFKNSVLCNVITVGILPRISTELIKKLVEICLLASLEREEGTFNNFSVVLEPPIPDEFNLHYKFERDIELTPTNLKKLAPAFNPNTHQIGVWFGENNGLAIWGFSPKRYIQFLSITSISPGKISLSCISDIDYSFKCLISLSQTQFINPFSSRSNPVANWLGRDGLLTSIHRGLDFNNIFSRMFQDGYGGIVLLVRENQSQWKRSIEQPSLYELASYINGYRNQTIVYKYGILSEFESRLNQKDTDSLKRENFKDKLTLALERAKTSFEDISNLSKIDGATVLSRDFTVLAFGAKIISKCEIQGIVITEPFEGSESNLIDISQWNVGTRHKSAAKFVFEQKDCLAIVVSEDRRISVFSWNTAKKAVQQLKNFESIILG